MSEAKRKNFIMWLLYAAFILVVWLLQETLFARLPIAGVALYPLPMAVACVAMLCGAESGGLFALCVGLFLSFTGQSYPGAMLLALCISGILCGRLCEVLLTRSLYSSLIVGLLAQILCLLLCMLMSFYFEGGSLNLLRLTLRQILLTLPLCPLLYLVSRQIRKAGAVWTE